MDTVNTSLRSRATDVARDLILENNDAPVSTEQLLALCYLRAWSDAAAVYAAGDRRAAVAHRLRLSAIRNAMNAGYNDAFTIPARDAELFGGDDELQQAYVVGYHSGECAAEHNRDDFSLMADDQPAAVARV